MEGRSSPPLLFTIGHSTRTIEDFMELLRMHGVKRLVDVRSFPRSRRHPQFNLDTLPEPLQREGIAYSHLRELGGLRRPRPDSPNAGWRNTSFRGYADYMQTPEFAAALKLLTELATLEPTAIMCAESLPWRCHRFLIADALVARGWRVEHIVSGSRTQPHSLASFAKVEDGHVTYPAFDKE